MQKSDCKMNTEDVFNFIKEVEYMPEKRRKIYYIILIILFILMIGGTQMTIFFLKMASIIFLIFVFSKVSDFLNDAGCIISDDDCDCGSGDCNCGDDCDCGD